MEGKLILQCDEIKRGIISLVYAHVSINYVLLRNIGRNVVFNGREGFDAVNKIAVGKGSISNI